MIEVVWLETGNETLQFHSTKLTIYHFDKNAYSKMDVVLAAQLVLGSTCQLIRDAILDNVTVLPIHDKNIYYHLTNICDHWNKLLNVTNSRDGSHP